MVLHGMRSILYVPSTGECVFLLPALTLHRDAVQVPVGVGLCVVMGHSDGHDGAHVRGEGYGEDVLLSLLKVVCSCTQWK